MPIPAALYKNLSKDERRRLWADYRVWIVEGAQHQGGGNQIVFAFGGVLVFAAALFFGHDFNLAVVGIVTFSVATLTFFGGRRAVRNEAQWRANNPFDTSKYQAYSDHGDLNN